MLLGPLEQLFTDSLPTTQYDRWILFVRARCGRRNVDFGLPPERVLSDARSDLGDVMRLSYTVDSDNYTLELIDQPDSFPHMLFIKLIDQINWSELADWFVDQVMAGIMRTTFD